MAQQLLVDYIKKLLIQGYDVAAIRNTLFNAGYSIAEVDDAGGVIQSIFQTNLSAPIRREGI